MSVDDAPTRARAQPAASRAERRTDPRAADPETEPTPDRASDAAEQAPRPAPGPVTARPWPWHVALAVVVLLGCAVVGLRDAAVGRGPGATSWTRAGVAALDGLRPGGWAAPVGLALLVLGALGLRSALARRGSTHLAVAGHGAAWLRRADVLPLAVAAAQDVGGVLAVTGSGGPRQVRLVVTPADPDDTETADAVRRAVLLRLAVLSSPPRVVVTLRRGEP